MTRLRYQGAHPIVFLEGRVGTVEPGQEFEVPDELAARFVARGDVEAVEETDQTPPARRARAPKPTAPEGE